MPVCPAPVATHALREQQASRASKLACTDNAGSFACLPGTIAVCPMRGMGVSAGLGRAREGVLPSAQSQHLVLLPDLQPMIILNLPMSGPPPGGA